MAPPRRIVRAGKAPARDADSVLVQRLFKARSSPAVPESSISDQLRTETAQAQPETASEHILHQLIPLQLQQSRQLEALSLHIAGIQRRLDSLDSLQERIVMVERLLGRVGCLAEGTMDIAVKTREELDTTAATIAEIWTSVDGTARVVDEIDEHVGGLGRQGDKIEETVDIIEAKVDSVCMTVDDVYSKCESIEEVVTGTEDALDGIREMVNGLEG
ncbi:hypothetical protein AC579_9477 [Pseudocercospora musae]|uniref:t-SNARE coiled-coil homology domain-containing protein n=1 Tax=Pseudocercospora musae TaxID=113226 RepID=A0A139HBL9_9PEZI|nr:hypothetical protein AC579_9477 [Pseudocercospora musae]